MMKLHCLLLLVVDGTQKILGKIIQGAKIQRKKTGNRHDKSLVYMFRKRFNTILKLNDRVNSNIAEKLMAHKKGLDGIYLQPTLEECYKEFFKAISDLTIEDNERLRVTNQKLEREKSELEEKEKGESISNKQLIDDLQTQLVQLQFELKAVTTSVQTKYDDELQQRKEKLGIY